MRAAQKVDLPAPAGPCVRRQPGSGGGRGRAYHDQRAILAHVCGCGRGRGRGRGRAGGRGTLTLGTRRAQGQKKQRPTGAGARPSAWRGRAPMRPSLGGAVDGVLLLRCLCTVAIGLRRRRQPWARPWRARAFSAIGAGGQRTKALLRGSGPPALFCPNPPPAKAFTYRSPPQHHHTVASPTLRLRRPHPLLRSHDADKRPDGPRTQA
jgi:hypothetical protein